MKKTLAFIFARGGSKGLPLKNQLILNGCPLIAYSIYIAKINPNINDVYVSTDSNKIASIAKEYRAKVINRNHLQKIIHLNIYHGNMQFKKFILKKEFLISL